MKRFSIITLFSVLQLIAVGCGYDGPIISVQELNKALSDSSRRISVVDVRPPVQFKKGHIKGAVNLPFEELDKHVEEIRTTKGEVAVICTCGKKALATAKRLSKKNVTVTLVEGGYKKWEAAGYPLEKQK